jgi:hypothetical protein
MAKITVGEYNMESREDIIECLNAIQPKLGTDIHCFNAHAGAITKPIPNDPRTYIVFWNNSIGRNITPSESAFFNTVLGIELTKSQKDGCKPGDSRANSILVDDENNVYAEIEQRTNGAYTLYILFDLPHTNTSYDLFYAILEQFLRKIGKEVEPRDMADSAKKRLIERYKTFIKAGINASIQQVEINIRQAQQTREHLRQQYAGTYASEREYAMRLEMLRSEAVTASDKIEKEIDKLMKHPKVDNMNVLRGVMTVQTKPLTYMDRAKRLRDLGVFRITINPDGREPNVTCLTPRSDEQIRAGGGYLGRLAHPHSTGTSGNMCWGNIGPGIVQLGLDKEFFTLIDLVIHFLENVNEDDAYGRRVAYWPTVTVVRSEPPLEAAPTRARRTTA